MCVPCTSVTDGNIWLVFVPPNTTAVCQPLDRAYMRPFKAALGRTSARCVGRDIQHHPGHIGNVVHSIAGLRSLLMTWTHGTLRETDVLAFATARHIAGRLFKHHRGRMAPELRTSAFVDHIVDMEPDDGCIVPEDPPVPDAYPALLEEELLDEPEDAREEAPVPVLNRFLARRVVYSDGRRMPSSSAK